MARLPEQVWHPEAVIEIKADVESPPLQLGPPATRYFRGRQALQLLGVWLLRWRLARGCNLPSGAK